MARKLWSSQTLPAGEKRLTLNPRPGPRESFGWAAGSVALGLVGLWLMGRGSCLLGVTATAVSGFMLWSIVRAHTRKEVWVVGPGTAQHFVRGRKTELTLVRRIRLEAERDSDERELLRAFVVHGTGETQLGEDWERTDDLEGLVETLGSTLGCPVDSLPLPTSLPRR